MAQFRINPAVVWDELWKLLEGSGWWEFEDKDAEKLLTYTAGALDMANAIIARCKGGGEANV